ncbi:DUF2147 domain-containing protein [Alloalcanivorax mobilis]|uniref:DUF2147 domain-containing protein n=1 Tax=Alloalcanivorax mobilis TaxID=2019569 RepID=UPI000B5B169C|nr:DUF2147 domain-containing protein [Alloalcanivorax mobilis]ASK36270.1 hypothetical protein CEK62_18735 [Alcanivorax sp. N3-2A]
MIRLFTGAALLALSLGASAADGNDINGVWRTKDGGYVQIYPQDGHWVGTVVGSRSGEARFDKNNPDESLRGRRLLGVTVLTGLDYAGDGEWSNGEIYSPDNGKTYSAKATLDGDDRLDVRGYIGISLIGRSQSWQRVSEDAPHLEKKLLH